MATPQDYVFFRWIWDNRPHYSEVSGKYLNYEFNPASLFCFAHVLTKKAYPGFRHYSKNIVLMTNEEHSLYDNWTHKARQDKRFDFVFLLREQLISEYYEWKNGKKHSQHCCDTGFSASLPADEKDLYQIRPESTILFRPKNFGA